MILEKKNHNVALHLLCATHNLFFCLQTNSIPVLAVWFKLDSVLITPLLMKFQLQTLRADAHTYPGNLGTHCWLGWHCFMSLITKYSTQNKDRGSKSLGQMLVALLWDGRHGFLLEQQFFSDSHKKHGFWEDAFKVIELYRAIRKIQEKLQNEIWDLGLNRALTPMKVKAVSGKRTLSQISDWTDLTGLKTLFCPELKSY